MISTSLLIIGAGGHGRVVVDVALSTNTKWSKIAFLDDAFPNIKNNLSYEILGKTTDLLKFKNKFSHVFVALGENSLRLHWINFAAKEGFLIPSLVHVSAQVSKFAVLGEGVLVCPGSIINALADIGLGCIINTGAIVEHDCKLKSGVHIAPNATLAGNVTVGGEAWIGIGASVLPNLSIGGNTIVGAGAIVCQSFGDNKVVIGIPAKEKQ